MLSVLKQSLLKIPLYHGTNQLFLDNIKRYGLGGYNQLEEDQVMEMFEELYLVCLRYTNFTTVDPVSNLVCSKILSHNDASWNYDGVYLTTSRYKALNHAVLNKYGSELLSTAMYLYEFIHKCRLHYRMKSNLHRQLIRQLKSSPLQPCILRVDAMDIRDLHLRGYQGTDMEGAMMSLDYEYSRSPAKCGDLCQLDFIYPRGRTPIKRLTVYEEVYEILSTL